MLGDQGDGSGCGCVSKPWLSWDAHFEKKPFDHTVLQNGCVSGWIHWKEGSGKENEVPFKVPFNQSEAFSSIHMSSVVVRKTQHVKLGRFFTGQLPFWQRFLDVKQPHWS